MRRAVERGRRALRVRAWHAAVAAKWTASSHGCTIDRGTARRCPGVSVVPAQVRPRRRILRAVLRRRLWVAGLLRPMGARSPPRRGERVCATVSAPASAGVSASPPVCGFRSRRTYSRRFAEFDLEIAIGEPAGFAVLWRLLNADGFAQPEPALDRAVTLSEQYRADVRACLQQGVHDALTSLLRAFASAPRARRAPRPPAVLLDESLIVVYRILFLLFAEARKCTECIHVVATAHDE